ncbi:MAG: hypothetical protein J6K13_04440 [Clostridia bacterium]|nr:hypothetical protein [Clostridia bacterium]
MKYCFQLLPHANIRYQESLNLLGAAELSCILNALHIDAEVRLEQIGGAPFLCFDAPELTPAQLLACSRYSALCFMCQEENGLLRPIDRPDTDYFPRDLAEVLKYKGKTSAVFTHMMINLALTASKSFGAEKPVTVLDPLCGRGTTLFVALQCGMNSVGIDMDRKDLKEAADYFSRYLQFHRLKHKLEQGARTVKGQNIPDAIYTTANSKQAFQAGDTRSLRMLLGDTGCTGALLKKTPADILVADLPYGVQHAPQEGRRPENFPGMLRRVLPSWKDALRPGAGVAISFNSLTLPRTTLIELMEAAGFQVLKEAPYNDFEHFVEQAVTRDVVVARKA